jgi:hypothetical protein
MQEYKIFQMDGIWNVYSGYTGYSLFIKHDIVYWSVSIADCYAWIKAKQEGLLG